ncbi:MAG: iron ABC transporter permease [Spirochaetaceae bacterium]|jgi:iron(III) transport system permease protein|nr:iron ABC transporter permease [Spirochaetaceae bacterium]
MVNRKKIVKLAVASFVFAAGMFWIASSLLGSFRSYYEKNSLKELSLYAKKLPTGDYQSWLDGLSDVVEGGSADIFVVDDDGDLSLEQGSETALAIWNDNEYSNEFRKGIESVLYDVPYKSPKTVSVQEEQAQKEMYVYFIPLSDKDSYVTGAVLIAIPQGGAGSDFESLLIVLAIIAWLLFTVILAIQLLSRDPITSYSVLFLFLITIAFVAYPLIEAVRLTFLDGGHLSLNIWKQTLAKDSLVALWGSIKLGILTASVSTLIGFAFAFLIERTSVKGKKLIGTLGTLPVISPPFSLTLSIILLFGNNGLITHKLLGIDNFSVYGLPGLVVVQTIGMFPIAFMTLSSVLKSIDSTIEDAALDLRATRMHTFLTVTLPLSLPGLLSAWLLVFTNSLADFANPLLLAGSYRVLSVDAYTQVTGRSDLGAGAALSLLLLMPSLTAFFAQRYWVNKKSVVTVTGKPSTRLAELCTKPVRIALTTFVVLCLVFILSLYATIIAGCFVKNWGIDYTFTLSNIGEAISRGKQAIFATVTLAAIATPIAGIMAMVAALVIVRQTFIGKRVLEVLLMTPFAIPGTLLGISYVLAFNKPPLLLVGTAAIIVINYIIRELPVGLETGSASLRQIDPAIEEAAQDLGADMPKVFSSIVLPLIRPAFLSSMSYTFVRSMTAVSAVIFLISARWYHLTVQIYNFSENIRFGLASVLCTVLIIIVLLVFGLLNFVVRDKGLTNKSIVR